MGGDSRGVLRIITCWVGIQCTIIHRHIFGEYTAVYNLIIDNPFILRMWVTLIHLFFYAAARRMLEAEPENTTACPCQTPRVAAPADRAATQVGYRRRQSTQGGPPVVHPVVVLHRRHFCRRSSSRPGRCRLHWIFAASARPPARTEPRILTATGGCSRHTVVWTSVTNSSTPQRAEKVTNYNHKELQKNDGSSKYY